MNVRLWCYARVANLPLHRWRWFDRIVPAGFWRHYFAVWAWAIRGVMRARGIK